MNIETAIKTAIEYEIRVRETYVEAMDEQIEPTGKRVFRLLAEEENGHVNFLREQLEQWKNTGRLSTAGLETAVPPAAAIEREIEKLEINLDRGTLLKDVNLLIKARMVEMETSAFYQKMVSELDGEGKNFFGRFLEIEEGHLALVDAEIDALEKAGFWFGMAEFDLEKS